MPNSAHGQVTLQLPYGTGGMAGGVRGQVAGEGRHRRVDIVLSSGHGSVMDGRRRGGNRHQDLAWRAKGGSARTMDGLTYEKEGA